MKKTAAISFLLFIQIFFGQNLEFKTLLEDKISIRALQIWDNKVWYAGTDSKFGYVSLKDTLVKKQIKLSDKNLQFRTLAQNKDTFYTINIESPAYFFKIDKNTLSSKILKVDTSRNAFYDALYFTNNNFAIAFSDPNEDQKLKIITLNARKDNWKFCDDCRKMPILENGEAAFAASNTNISSKANFIWIATGGKKSRVYISKLNLCNWQIFETPFIQGTSSTGIYSIDFYNEKFGIAVGGDYTKQAENINNIATTNDGGKTWHIQASGKNGGYKTCVKIRPKSKGKDIIAVGDQNIEFSNDFGKTWTKISDEKNLYVCEWVDKNTLVFAGKDRILKAAFRE